jgi:predicted phosphodiesterase
VSNLSELYAVTSNLPVFTAGDETVRVLHVSDLHLNPGAFDVIRSVVTQFQVDVVIDTGDLTDFGSAAESRYVGQIPSIGAPYVYVRGNHDSSATQASVAALPDATVLDGPEVVEVAGIRFLGQGDPRFTPDKSTRDDDADDDVLLAVGRTMARSARTAVDPPHVVAVHDPVSAQPLLGVSPLVLAGHTHRREDVEQDGTLLVVQGSTGGAGLRALEGEEPTPITMTVLYLEPASGQLQAYDDITLGGLGTTDARISRTVVVPPVADRPLNDPAAEPTRTEGS